MSDQEQAKRQEALDNALDELRRSLLCADTFTALRRQLRVVDHLLIKAGAIPK